MISHEIDYIAAQVVASVQHTFTFGRWLTVKEACDYAKIKRDTLMRWVEEGYVYGTKRGGKWIIDRLSIDSFYDQDRLHIL